MNFFTLEDESEIIKESRREEKRLLDLQKRRDELYQRKDGLKAEICLVCTESKTEQFKLEESC